jgi:hypothetical protein
VEEENGRNENCFIPDINLLPIGENAEFSDVHNVIVGHLAKLTLYFNYFMPENVAKYSWLRNQFDTDVEDSDDNI